MDHAANTPQKPQNTLYFPEYLSILSALMTSALSKNVNIGKRVPDIVLPVADL
jgi:hypothetical protein